MKTKQTPEVISTRKEANRLLLLVPNKPYSDCTDAEKKVFNDMTAAFERHRIAVRAARS